MNKTLKKTLSIIVAILMIVTTVPFAFAADDYAVNSIPTNFLIDCSTGVIIEKNLRGEEVIEKLEELLK